MIMYMMSQWNFTHNVTQAGPKVTNTTHAPLLRIRCPSLLHSRTENELMARSSAGTLYMPFLSSDGVNFISGRWAHNHCATLLVILVILSHCHQWQAQSHLDPTIPEALERERAVWAKMLYSNRDKQEKERSKAWPGTVEVMGSEREGSRWEFNLEIQASCGHSWLVTVNAAACLPAGRASLISCAVYSRVIIASHYRATALGRLWISYQLQSPHHRRLSLITQ